MTNNNTIKEEAKPTVKKILGINVYSLTEVAEMIGVTTVTIHNYIKSGTLDARKLGGKWYIAEDTIKKFISGGGNK